MAPPRLPFRPGELSREPTKAMGEWDGRGVKGADPF